MTDAVIRLDRSKPFSECRGERQPDDPTYRVHFYQGQMVGKDMILLPFDSKGELVPDDGRTEPWPGKDSDGKPIVHFPLYNQPMRDLLERKRKRQAVAAAKVESSVDDDDDLGAGGGDASDDVNFESYLRGEAKYDWTLIQAAARKRFSRIFTSKRQLVEDLVLDERLIPEAQLSPDLARHLPAKETA
jgi:hypothetical protein